MLNSNLHGTTLVSMTVLYFFATRRPQRRWRWLSVGLVVATLLSLRGLARLFFYTSHIGAFTSRAGAQYIGRFDILVTKPPNVALDSQHGLTDFILCHADFYSGFCSANAGGLLYPQTRRNGRNPPPHTRQYRPDMQNRRGFCFDTDGNRYAGAARSGPGHHRNRACHGGFSSKTATAATPRTPAERLPSIELDTQKMRPTTASSALSPWAPVFPSSSLRLS